MLQVGSTVIYHDTKNRPHDALVTAVHSNWANPCINLLFVSKDETMNDQYGRQIIRQSSVSHTEHNPAPGNYWRRASEAPNA